MATTAVYAQENFAEPISAQHDFTNHFDLDNPMQAMSYYARIMHAHTKQQLDTATTSARRRSEASSTSASLSHEDSRSSTGSVSSTSS
ncbi:hypothetical protein EV356DRAFT_578450 [Viridothelium virens]|uniref:Uncharacterized protein n=1 Tax=Viridothelium virens TaxID=1048519 RepID=A0A6A6H3L2_VIRVR|nr:hypothetical protein EV356DRAFT_578450 [Viridothelium virens]